MGSSKFTVKIGPKQTQGKVVSNHAITMDSVIV